MSSGGPSPLRFYFAFAALLLVTAVAEARNQPYTVRSKPLEAVNMNARWQTSGDKNTDVVLRSVLLEGKGESGGLSSMHRRLQYTSCPVDASGTCARLPASDQSKIRATLISACSTVLPTGSIPLSSCCSAIKGSSGRDYSNNAACLCGDNGGLAAFVSNTYANTILQQCQPGSTTGPGAVQFPSQSAQLPPPSRPGSPDSQPPPMQPPPPSSVPPIPAAGGAMPFFSTTTQQPPPLQTGFNAPVLTSNTPSMDFTVSNVANSLGIGSNFGLSTPSGK